MAVKPRRRVIYAVALALVIALGLASRRYAGALPVFIAEYAGDTLWALMVFLWVSLLRPRWTTRQTAALSLGFAYLIEISQLYHAPWLDTLRHTRPGHLVLGDTFVVSDFLCYTVGVALGCAGEWRWRK